MLEKLSKESFDPYVGAAFILQAGETTFDAVLIECSAIGGGHGKNDRVPFSLVFRGPFDPVGPQQVFQVSSEELGSLELFLVPVGPDAEGMRYEAIFN